MVFTACQEKQDRLKAMFTSLSPEEKYQKIIELGRQLPPFNPAAKTPSNLVLGCQSLMHLETRSEDGRLFFNADSEALISKGLAALLIAIYSGEEPHTIAECPPSFIVKIGLQAALSPSRSSGLASLYHRMRQEALQFNGTNT
jgi:cysteine desulfuration protein SufE